MNSLTNALFGVSGGLSAKHAAYQQMQQKQASPLQAIHLQEVERLRREEARRVQLQRDMCEFLEYAIEADAYLKQLFTAWLTARKLES